MQNHKPALMINLLKLIRDSRLVWDVMGSIYNKRIYDAIVGLYDYIVHDPDIAGQQRIIDVGMGRGYVSLLLAAQNPRAMITGIDYSPMQIRAAEKLRLERNIFNCSFVQGNVMDVRFDDKTFDAAVSVGSIKHWPDGLHGLKEIHRVLKPGGWLVISETDEGASDKSVREFIRRFNPWFIPNSLLFWGLRRVIFGQSYTEKTLTDVVCKAGFQNIEYQRVPACPYVLIKARK